MSGGRGAGDRPLTYAGAYDATRTYLPREAVTSGGSTYMAIRNSTGVVPPDATYWINLGGTAAVVGTYARDRFVLGSAGPQNKALSFTPVANSPHVFRNGVYRDEGTDYSISSSTLSILSPMGALVSDIVEARYVVAGPAAALTGYPAAVLADSPAVYWRLGESSGTQATDASGNARHGTYSGTPTFGVAGLLVGDPDTCVTFSGDDRVDIAYASWMDATANITVEAVIKTSTTANMSIIDRDDDPSVPRIFQFRKSSAGKLQFILIGTSVVTVTGTTTLHDGVARHVAATYDGATIKLYVNGVLDGSASTSVALPTGASAFRAGANHSAGYNAFWVGQLDEIAYYKSALSAARITAHYAASGL